MLFSRIYITNKIAYACKRALIHLEVACILERQKMPAHNGHIDFLYYPVFESVWYSNFSKVAFNVLRVASQQFHAIKSKIVYSAVRIRARMCFFKSKRKAQNASACCFISRVVELHIFPFKNLFGTLKLGNRHDNMTPACADSQLHTERERERDKHRHKQEERSGREKQKIHQHLVVVTSARVFHLLHIMYAKNAFNTRIDSRQCYAIFTI